MKNSIERNADLLEERLKAEARAASERRAPSGFHARVMRAVAAEAEGKVRPGFPVPLVFRMAAAGAVAAALAFFVLPGGWKGTDPTGPEQVAGVGQAESFWFDYRLYLESPELLENHFHGAAAVYVMNEYEYLSRDAAMARDFVQSMAPRWFATD